MADHSAAVGSHDLIDVQGLAAPEPRGEEAAWYARCRDRLLSFHRCDGCSAAVFPPRSVCPLCGSTDLHWEDAAGSGTVYSFTIQRRAARPGMPEPAVIALIDVDEGFRYLSRLVCDPATVHIGMTVDVRFAAADDGTTIVPVFVPS